MELPVNGAPTGDYDTSRKCLGVASPQELGPTDYPPSHYSNDTRHSSCRYTGDWVRFETAIAPEFETMHFALQYFPHSTPDALVGTCSRVGAAVRLSEWRSQK